LNIVGNSLVMLGLSAVARDKQLMNMKERRNLVL